MGSIFHVDTMTETKVSEVRKETIPWLFSWLARVRFLSLTRVPIAGLGNVPSQRIFVLSAIWIACLTLCGQRGFRSLGSFFLVYIRLPVWGIARGMITSAALSKFCTEALAEPLSREQNK